MRKPNTETHQECRSLLQKAVRRGHPSLVRKVAGHLRQVGDTSWLRLRVAVINFEECWPLGAEFNPAGDFAESVDALVRAASSVKFKDAAGLGSLGYALSEGDQTVLTGSPEDKQIKVICEAIKRPGDFWGWVSNKCGEERQNKLVDAAWRSYRRGGWPWDRAFMQAAAYLSVTQPLPEVETAKNGVDEFPFWVALDKHTPQGKVVLRGLAQKTKTPWRHLVWTSFYYESALTNDAVDSPWWKREVEWRLRKVGLDHGEARIIWSKVRPLMAEELESHAEELRRHIEQPVGVTSELFPKADGGA